MYVYIYIYTTSKMARWPVWSHLAWEGPMDQAFVWLTSDFSAIQHDEFQVDSTARPKKSWSNADGPIWFNS